MVVNFAARVAAQAIFLCLLFGLHAFWLIAWCMYMLWWPVYHSLEFVMTALFNRKELRWNSFLLDQSKEYMLAFTVSTAEFWISYMFFGDVKRQLCGLFGGKLLLLAVSIMWLGQCLRTLGMATAGFAFTHQIQTTRRDGHELVTSGVYSIFRHPGYTGWFYASIATQIVLCNPLCLGLYAWAAWRFFAHRIPREEFQLYSMFGPKYLAYRDKSYVFIPFIPSPMDILSSKSQ